MYALLEYLRFRFLNSIMQPCFIAFTQPVAFDCIVEEKGLGYYHGASLLMIRTQTHIYTHRLGTVDTCISVSIINLMRYAITNMKLSDKLIMSCGIGVSVQ